MNIKQRYFIKHTEIRDLKEGILEQYNEDFVNLIYVRLNKKLH